jgi:subtilisin family serine protease
LRVLFRLFRVVAVLAAVVALAGPALSAVTDMASAVSGCASTGSPLRYVVLFDAEVPAPQAARSVRAACGTTAAYYPQIGVGVVTSAEPAFKVRFGADRAYSAQAEALASTQRAELSRPIVSPAAARAPEAAQALRVDRSAEQWDMALIHAPQARMINRGSSEVLVGVLDSGIDATHPDLAAAVDPTRSAGCLSGKPDQSRGAWSPSTSAHGTHVAGTIAAADDGRGITGVAPGVRLASVKVVDDEGFIYPEYAVCGFMWAAQQRMRIANNSYSLDPWLLTCSDVPGQAVAYEAVRRAVQYATAHGVLSIAAAGNERMDLANPRQDLRSPDNAPDPRPRPVNQHCNVLPAELPGVVAVSAIGAYGSGVVSVTAPGGDWAQPSGAGSSGCVLSTVPGGYGSLCGTSMAAPHASGVAALLASVRPEVGPQELATLLRDQADPLPCPARSREESVAECAGDAFYGHGVVDALTAVTAQPAPARSNAAARPDLAAVVRGDRTQR